MRHHALSLAASAALFAACDSGPVKQTDTSAEASVALDSGEADVGGDADGDAGGDAGGESGGESGGDSSGDSGGDSSGDSGGGSSGDSGGDSGGESGGDGEPDPVAADTRLAGSFSYSRSTDSVTVSAECDLDIMVFTPMGTPVGTVVVSHGFIRSGDQMEGWAEHYASWGFLAIVPNLCHSSLWDTDHEANGAAIAELVDQMGVGPAAYVGHSAGGLASALALAADSSAVGGVGLDPVDSGSLGANAAFSMPFHGLFAEPGNCNSRSNGVDMVNGGAVLVSEAGHCDFESPRDAICDLACGENNPNYSDDEIEDVVHALSTAALLGLFGDTATHDAWWTSGGEFYDAYLSTGAISPM